MTVVLALDVATTLGYAVGPIGTERPLTALEASLKGGVPQPLSGVHTVTSNTALGVGAFASAYARWLEDMLTLHNPDRVVFEAPFVNAKRPATAFRLLGMAYITQMVCYRKRVICQPADMGSVRKYFCGVGRAKREIIKKLVQDACDQRGWTYADDNESDALAVWAFAQACLLGAV